MPLNKEEMRAYQARRRAKDRVLTDTTEWGSPGVLNDGQLWWPGHQGLHPPECGIKHVREQ